MVVTVANHAAATTTTTTTTILRLSRFFRDYLGEPVPECQNQNQSRLPGARDSE